MQKTLALTALVLLGCGADEAQPTTTPNETAETQSPTEAAPEEPSEGEPEVGAVEQAEPGMPAATDVCVEADDGSLSPGSAVPSRAGVYDPDVPPEPAYLNWMVAGQGCVTYPGASERSEACGGAPRPVVTSTLCGQ